MSVSLDAIARRPRLAALLGAMCIAFSGIFYRYAEVSPSTGTVFRCLFGLPILLGVALLERRRFGPLPKATILLAAIAGVFFAGDLTLWHHAIDAVGAGLATVLGNLQVLVVGLVAWAALGERPSRPTLVAVPIVLAGVALIAGLGGGAYGRSPVRGVVFGLLTAVCYAGYLIIIRRGGRDLRRPAGLVAVATASTAATAAVIGLLVGDLDPIPPPPSLGLAGAARGDLAIRRLPVDLALAAAPARRVDVDHPPRPTRGDRRPLGGPACRGSIAGAACRSGPRRLGDRGRDAGRRAGRGEAGAAGGGRILNVEPTG